MTYKKACEVLDKTCKNWETLYNNCKLEDTIYRIAQKKAREDLQNLAENTFSKITDNVIEAKLIPDVAALAHTITIDIHLDSGKTVTSTIYPWAMSSTTRITEEQFADALLLGIKSTLGNALVYESCITPAELTKIANYILLIDLDVKQGIFFPAVQKILDEQAESYDRHLSTHRKLHNLITRITQALAEASRAWYEEYTLLPGMRVILKDPHTEDTSVRIIKTLPKQNLAPLLRFTDGTYVSANSDRILKLSTWLANNDQYRSIVNALKISITGVDF